MDVSGRSVQQELLKLIESSGGADYRVGGRNCFSALSGTFDPSSLCHIFCGAFTGLAELAKKRLGRSKSIGFGDHSPTGGRTDIRSLLNEFGLLTELTNRIERVILMPPVTVDTLAEIAGAPNGIINQQNGFTAPFGLKLALTSAAVREVCEWSFQTGTLARGIRSVLSRLGDEAMAAELTGEIRVDAAEVRRAIEADSQALLA
jgi:ATP-dependent Clp protease ATP-binding subunit ClpX